MINKKSIVYFLLAMLSINFFGIVAAESRDTITPLIPENLYTKNLYTNTISAQSAESISVNSPLIVNSNLKAQSLEVSTASGDTVFKISSTSQINYYIKVIEIMDNGGDSYSTQLQLKNPAGQVIAEGIFQAGTNAIFDEYLDTKVYVSQVYSTQVKFSISPKLSGYEVGESFEVDNGDGVISIDAITFENNVAYVSLSLQHEGGNGEGNFPESFNAIFDDILEENWYVLGISPDSEKVSFSKNINEQVVSVNESLEISEGQESSNALFNIETNFENIVNFEDNVDFQDNASVRSNLSVDNDFKVHGNSQFNDSANFREDVSIEGTLELENLTLSQNLTTTGNITSNTIDIIGFGQNQISGNTTFSGWALFNNFTQFENGISVTSLAGEGNAYACLDNSGVLFRSNTPCSEVSREEAEKLVKEMNIKRE
ncbi:MAG: hypothetical protein V1824_03110 [archaeon]